MYSHAIAVRDELLRQEQLRTEELERSSLINGPHGQSPARGNQETAPFAFVPTVVDVSKRDALIGASSPPTTPQDAKDDAD